MTSEWKPWEESSAWKSKAAFFTWLRGQIRKSIWQNYPPRNEMKQERLRPVTEEDFAKGISRRCKKVGDCEFCDEIFPASKLQIDHKIPAGKLSSEEDLTGFIKRIACMKVDMRLCCEPCHKIHTYAEKMGISFEEARIEKDVIAFSKIKTIKQLEILGKYNYTKDMLSNAQKRKDAYREVLKNERN